MCKRLSLWWSNGDSDAIFWRTPNSGGRATARARKNTTTRNHYGDVMASDPIGQPLMDLVTVELKSGYSRHTIGDILDRPSTQKSTLMEQWFLQAHEVRKMAGAKKWLLIAKRDRKEALIYMPYSHKIQPWFSSRARLGPLMDIAVARLEPFLKRVSPQEFVEVLRN